MKKLTFLFTLVLFASETKAPPLELRYQWQRLVGRSLLLQAEVKEVNAQLTTVRQQMDEFCKLDKLELKYNQQKDEFECGTLAPVVEKKVPETK